MTWFPLFLMVCVLLAAFGRPQDRPAWFVLALAGGVNLLLGLTLDQWDSPMKLPAFSSLELLTAYGLLKYGKTKMATFQSFACLFAWIAHTLLFIDLITGASFIYDNYESVILGIAAYQVTLSSDGFIHIFNSVFLAGSDSRCLPSFAAPSVRYIGCKRSKILPEAR